MYVYNKLWQRKTTITLPPTRERAHNFHMQEKYHLDTVDLAASSNLQQLKNAMKILILQTVSLYCT